mmetsp:Transcript_47368/g.74035  ORF Transcript_47368/g.74035 Transcript_47368/m.74035 type:complete len:223 (+) Transcript_47368:410-1078(+)
MSSQPSPGRVGSQTGLSSQPALTNQLSAGTMGPPAQHLGAQQSTLGQLRTKQQLSSQNLQLTLGDQGAAATATSEQQISHNAPRTEVELPAVQDETVAQHSDDEPRQLPKLKPEPDFDPLQRTRKRKRKRRVANRVREKSRSYDTDELQNPTQLGSFASVLASQESSSPVLNLRRVKTAKMDPRRLASEEVGAGRRTNVLCLLCRRKSKTGKCSAYLGAQLL